MTLLDRRHMTGWRLGSGMNDSLGKVFLSLQFNAIKERPRRFVLSNNDAGWRFCGTELGSRRLAVV